MPRHCKRTLRRHAGAQIGSVAEVLAQANPRDSWQPRNTHGVLFRATWFWQHRSAKIPGSRIQAAAQVVEVVQAAGAQVLHAVFAFEYAVRAEDGGVEHGAMARCGRGRYRKLIQSVVLAVSGRWSIGSGSDTVSRGNTTRRS